MAQQVFRRYEIKYLLDQQQKEAVLAAMKGNMVPDRYGCTTIRNIYYDTENYRLIRRSLEHPVYKEKLRIRSYSRAEGDSTVFVELKKKFEGVVYKRRLPLTYRTAQSWLDGGQLPPQDTQIAREIEYFRKLYAGIAPKVYLSYHRQAWYGKNDPDFRMTFDSQICCRRDVLDLGQEPGGAELLPPDITLMEVKCAGGMPLWLTRTLAENRIFKASFSKYGTAYQKLIYPQPSKEVISHG